MCVDMYWRVSAQDGAGAKASFMACPRDNRWACPGTAAVRGVCLGGRRVVSSVRSPRIVTTPTA
eukprot:14791363-Alexandrium_andersonii.AAC.1